MPATTTDLTGVFVNGRIVPDARPLPDGTRVRFVPLEYAERPDEPILVAAPSQRDLAILERKSDPC